MVAMEPLLRVLHRDEDVGDDDALVVEVVRGGPVDAHLGKDTRVVSRGVEVGGRVGILGFAVVIVVLFRVGRAARRDGRVGAGHGTTGRDECRRGQVVNERGPGAAFLDIGAFILEPDGQSLE